MKPEKKWILGFICLLASLLILKVGLLFFAKPRVTVDYLAEYNRICRPQNYDPNQNAAIHYRKAFDSFVSMPGRLRKPYVNWPGDFDEGELAILERWLVLNAQPFDHFRVAVSKPYCWQERQRSDEDNMFSIMFPDLVPFSNLVRALMWKAKLEAMNGEFKSAFENIIFCYRAAGHKCYPGTFLTTQYTGLGVRQSAIRNAFVILDRGGVGSDDLEFFQTIFQEELDRDSYVPDLRAERFLVYDVLQRTFVDNGRGTGRLAWSSGWYSHRPDFAGRLKECFWGPTKNQIVEQTEEVLAMSNLMMSKTPWQIVSEEVDYFGEIDGINRSNPFLRNFGLRPDVTFHLYHTTKAQAEALVAVIAILRFKADTGKLAETLDELVAAGYLKTVPIDPYSGGALIYKVSDEGFELYSVGDDLSDDGGMIEAVTRPLWRSEPGTEGMAYRVRPSDMIFWPVMY